MRYSMGALPWWPLQLIKAQAMAIDRLDAARLQTPVIASLGDHWKFFLVEGIVLAVLGVGAIVVPAVATFAVEMVIGWVLLIAGIVGLISTLRMQRAPAFRWSLLSAVAGIVAGALLLVWPLSGAFSLTVILTVFLFLEGIASIMMALSHSRGFSGRWGMLLVSGIIDLILAGVIIAGLPGTAAWAIGLLVGINMLFGGAALISMALHARNASTVR
jgi:uncharacterized membrane protein HdeD (DUF308 family)